jgi:hypothetical protein
VYLYRAEQRRWERLDKPGTDGPQNLYELTSLAYDSVRDRIILHGGGLRRDELWTFDLRSRAWSNMRPRSEGPPPECSREAVYLPEQDSLVTLGEHLWIWKASENAWRKLQVPFEKSPPAADKNRAMVYNPKRKIVFLVIGDSGDDGVARLYALRPGVGF